MDDYLYTANHPAFKRMITAVAHAGTSFQSPGMYTYINTDYLHICIYLFICIYVYV